MIPTSRASEVRDRHSCGKLALNERDCIARRQLLPLVVLNELIDPDLGGIGLVADDRVDLDPKMATGTPAPFAKIDLIAAVCISRRDRDGLDLTAFFDRRRKASISA
ncbi:hypothetical protein GCM10020258_57940 [Sphingomonas yabuuchiae]